MAEDFRLLVGAKIVDSDIQKQLDSMKPKSITVKTTTNGTKEIKQLEDELGRVHTVTTKVDKDGKELSSTLTQVKERFKEVAKDTKTARTEVQKFSDASGKVTTATTRFNKAGENLGTITKSFTSDIVKAEKHTKSLGEQFISNTKKVAQFGMSTAVLGTFSSLVYGGVEAVKELDDSLTELKKVSDLSGASLDSYTETAFNMARDLSTTASNVTDATAQFVQAGYNLSDSSALSKYAIMLQSIADNEMDVSDATSFLTSTLLSFNMTAKDAEHVINSVNETSNQFAITSNDISDNLSKVSGVANIAGVSFEELLGLLTASTSLTRDASKSANAFKSIFINLQQMSADGTVPKLSKQFSEFGISMTDQNGAIRSAYDLLQDLSAVYKKVSDSTDVDKQNKMRTLLEDIGGKYNYNVLLQSLNGFDIAVKATEVATNSAGSANEEFQKSLDSISKKLEAVQGAFQELMASGGLGDFIKNILDLTTKLINFASSPAGNFIGKVALMTASMKALSLVMNTQVVKAFGNLFKVIASEGVAGLKLYSAEVKTTAETTGLLKSAMGGVWVALAVGAFEVLSFGIEQLDKASQSYYNTQQDIITKSEERITTLTKETDALKDLSTKLADAKGNKQALSNLYTELNEKAGVSAEIINGETEAYNKATLAIEARIKANEKEIAISEEKKRKANLKSAKSLDLTSSGIGNQLSNVNFNELINMTKETNSLKKSRNDIMISYITESSDFKENLSKISTYIQKGMSEAISSGSNSDLFSKEFVNNYIEGLVSSLDYSTDEIEKKVKDLMNNKDISKLYSDYLESITNPDSKLNSTQLRHNIEVFYDELMTQIGDDSSDASKVIKSSYESLFNALSSGAKQLSELNISVKPTIDIYSELEEQFSSVIKAQLEMDETGEMTIETAKSLVESNSSLSNSLVATATGYKISKSELENLMNLKKADYQNDLNNATNVARTVLNAQNNTASAYGLTTAQIKTQIQAKIALLKVTQKEQEYQGVQSQGLKFLTPFKAQSSAKATITNSELDKLEKVLTNITNAETNVNNVNSAFQQLTNNLKASSSSMSDTTDATKAQNDALEAQEKALKEAQDAWEDAVDSAEKLRDMIVDMIKDTTQGQIDALQDELDKLNDIFEARKDILSITKEANDYAKTLAEKNKEVADIESELLSLQNDNSRDAIAKRIQLQDELADATKDRNELVADHAYDTSVSEIEKEQKAVQDSYNARIEALQNYLNNESAIMTDALNRMANANSTLFNDLLNWNQTYGNGIRTNVTSVWDTAINALNNYKNLLSTISGGQVSTYTPTYTAPTSTPTYTAPTVQASSNILTSHTVKKNDTLWALAQKYYGSGSQWTKIQKANNGVDPYNLRIGSVLNIPKYAKGTIATDSDQLAMINELGDELVVRANGQGDLSSLTKGSGVIPANLTKNLMEWGKFNPNAFTNTQTNNNNTSSLSIGDIIINGGSNLTASDLNGFRKNIVTDVMNTIQHNKLKLGVRTNQFKLS